MLNLNQVIRTKVLKQLKLVFVVILFNLMFNFVCAQTQSLNLPEEFQQLSINSRALEKSIEINVDNTTSQAAQNITLDKTGVILYLVASSKIKGSNTKIRVFSDNGEEFEVFSFSNNSVFALVDPINSYSIIQEVIPNCEQFTKTFNLESQNVICPDIEEYKILERVKISSDSVLKIRTNTLKELYMLPIMLVVNTEELKDDFQLVKVDVPNSELQDISSLSGESSRENVNISSLLNKGDVCVVGKTKSTTVSECSFTNSGVKTISKFRNGFGDKILQSNNLNFVFSSPSNIFSTLNHEILFTFIEEKSSQNKSLNVSKDLSTNISLGNYNYSLFLNLGLIANTRTRIKKGIYALTTPLELNKLVNKISIKFPFDKLEGIINPFTDKNNDSVLTNISIGGNEKNNSARFKISLDNNVLIKNLAESSPSPTPEELRISKAVALAQITEPSSTPVIKPDLGNVEITTFLPGKDFVVSLKRTYTSVEQDLAPSVDEMGKAIEIVNNKSKVELVLSNATATVDFASLSNMLELDLSKASELLKDRKFTRQVTLSGLLIPPDFSPVLEDGYRATVELSMTIDLKDKNSVKIIYSDLKTKDETPLTNFFKFSFLSQGLYNAIVKFDADRKKIFLTAGILQAE